MSRKKKMVCMSWLACLEGIYLLLFSCQDVELLGGAVKYPLVPVDIPSNLQGNNVKPRWIEKNYAN